MADEIISAPAESSAPVATSESAPVAASSVDSPVVKTEAPASSPVETTVPTAEPAPAIEAKPEDTTVLGADKEPEPKPEVKPEAKVDEKPVDGEQPTEVKPEEAPLPTYEDFKLPEGVALDAEQITDFNKMLGEFETKNKADHAAVQEFGQKAIDKYVAEMQTVTKRLHEGYQAAWTKQKSDWFTQFKNDPEIGGNRLDTTSAAVRNAIETFGGTAEQKAEFRKLMKDTGIGNAPPLIRTVANLANEINRLKAKYESEDGTKQLAATKPNAPKLSKIEKRYGSV